MGKNNWEAYFNAVKKQDWKTARTVLNQIAKVEKANPQVYLKLGDVCQRAGDVPNAIVSYSLSARILRHQGFNQKAIALYKIILRLDPSNGDAISKSQEIISEMEAFKGAHAPSPAISFPPAGPVDIPEPETTVTPVTSVPELELPEPKPAEEISIMPPEPPEEEIPEPQQPVRFEDLIERTDLTVAPPQKEEPAETVAAPSHAVFEDLLERTELTSPVSKDAADISGPGELPKEEGPEPEEEKEMPERFEIPERELPVSEEELPEQEAVPFRAVEEFSVASSGGGEDISTMAELFSQMPEDEFSKMLDDLVVPLSERSAASTVPEIFSGMSEDEYKMFLGEMDVKKYADNGRIVEEGDSGDSLYLIKSGSARVIAHLFGKEVELALLDEGDTFGEIAFLTGRPRTATVVANGPVQVYEISRSEIERLIERNPDVLSKLEDFYESRVKDTIKKVMPQ
ncbi:MAG: cyclic nucleotide-binding domain-containing protein [Nitrospirae bacterium]|nr:cyclic nucleotide-binding domain-containing protein [Nitrospirota bacterium]